MPSSQFGIGGDKVSTKELVFDANEQAPDTRVTVRTHPDTITDITVTLPDQTGTLALAGQAPADSFTTIQTPLGTSPVATSATDVLTLDSTSGDLDITGDSLTDTVDYSLSATGVTPATYGSATQSAVIIVDNKGRITSASNVAINGDGGITSLNGLTTTIQTFAVTTTGTDFTVSSAGSTHSLNLPSASDTARGVVTTATQSFKGQKTFSTNLSTEATVVVQAISGQTGSLLRVNDSAATEISSVSSSGRFLAPLGAVGTPSFAFLPDPDSGMYSTGSNSISLATTGVERIRVGVSNSGFINIGGNYTAQTHGVGITSIGSNVPTLGLKAISGQSAVLMDYRSFAGTVLGGITVAGGTFAGDTAATANKSHIFKSIATTSSSLAAKAITSQSANLLDLVNSSGTTVAGATVAGQIYAMSGANSTPGFAFATAGSLDSNTGFYSPGADRIGITNGAAQSAEISAAGRTHLGSNFTADTHQVLITSAINNLPTLGLREKATQTSDFVQWVTSDGTGVYGRIAINGCIRVPSGSVGAGTLSYGFESDTNTGIYQSAADAIDFATNGNRVFNMNSKGNLRAFHLHNNATANGDADNQDIRSGTTSTSVVGTENIESYSASDMQWLRVGNVVTVSGNFIDLSIPSSSTWTYLTIRVPVGTAATTVESISGTMSIVDGGNKLVFAGTVTNDGSGNATIGFFPATSGAMTPLTFHFTYEVQ